MRWEIGALKMLAQNQTVPGIALKDAVEQLEIANAKIALLEKRLAIARQGLASEGIILRGDNNTEGRDG